ncbi:MAG: class I SAM-dependent methyltransferase [Christensenellaceae bacterium]|jgi:O-methyltransferase involved in polyketide biosynthesis|nr:class I SAM-dependent methyltransferase [Christensenellaceae bacterium]
MKTETKLQEQTVQSTMLLPVYGRAKASRMFPGILYDEGAIQIVDGMDYDFKNIDKNYGTEYICLCCLLRAKRFEERCLSYMKNHPNGTVINLGSGLDMTFERVDNGSIHWYNIDLPDAIAFRKQYIPNKERSTDIAKSMLDYSWLDDIETTDGSVFIIAGGLFYYFEEKVLRELICKITSHFKSGDVFFDAQSKTAVKVSNRMVRKTGNKGSMMYFSVNNPQELKSWSPNIRQIESVEFFGKSRKNKAFKRSTRILIWALEKLKMGSLISIQW